VTVAGNGRPAPVDAQPPAALTPDTFAARLYDALEPLARSDPQVGWSLLILCNAVGTLLQLVEDYVRDTPDGPGWSGLLDLNRCPSEALPWLAQLVGVRLLPNTTDAQRRARIVSTDGFRRGTPAAIMAAVQATLTGTQTVTLTERDGDPYVLTLYTLAQETPDALATRNALLSQKPAGIVANFTGTLAGQTYATVNANFASYTAVAARYVTYNDLLLNH
jgi:hypothetical protein